MMKDKLALAGGNFRREAGEHRLTVLHDSGLHRHLLCRNPSGAFYWFEIVTWPGALTYSGDMGTYTFRRDPDMLEFFGRGGSIDPQYWAQKVQDSDGVRTYSADLTKEHIENEIRNIQEAGVDEDHPGLVRALRELADDSIMTESEDRARAELDDFEHDGWTFTDTWEWDLRELTPRFLWACHAIRWAVQQYHLSKTPSPIFDGLKATA